MQGFGGMSAAVAAPSFLGAPTPTAGQTQPSNFFSLQQAPQPSFNAGPVFGSGMQANPFGNPGAPASQPVDGGLFMFGQAQGTAGAGAPPMFGGLSMFSQGAAAPDAGAAGGFSLGAGGGEGGAAGRKKFRARRAGG